MQSGKQQQILGFFIEEAKEHLDTIEEGLLNLKDTLVEPERINELFRAAHSVKGGAAMLGFGSIQKTAHRLEDCFKVLKENEIETDQKLESLFLNGLDTLKELLERLQGPFGLREEEAEATLQAAEPNFTQLQAYLNYLVSGEGAIPGEAGGAATQKPPANFAAQVTAVLKKMLQLFKGADSPASRQQLGKLCQYLVKLGNGIEPWTALIETLKAVLTNPKLPFKVLAPVAIKEIKQASGLVLAGKASSIAPSKNLQQLVAKTGVAVPAAGQPPADARQITVPLEPKAAAKVLAKAFSREHLVVLIKALHQTVRG